VTGCSTVCPHIIYHTINSCQCRDSRCAVVPDTTNVAFNRFKDGCVGDMRALPTDVLYDYRSIWYGSIESVAAMYLFRIQPLVFCHILFSSTLRISMLNKCIALGPIRSQNFVHPTLYGHVYFTRKQSTNRQTDRQRQREITQHVLWKIYIVLLHAVLTEVLKRT